MKITTLILLLIGSATFAQYTAIPDPNFEQALIDLGYDDVLDGQVLTSNIEFVIELDVFDKNIDDITGIEGFTSLESFFGGYNNYSTIDLSHNTALTYLNLLPSQALTTLDISNNIYLEDLTIACPLLSTVDLSNNPNLKSFYSRGAESNLTSLDLSNNPLLESLRVRSNELTELDLSNNPLLSSLECDDNNLSSLTISNMPNLEILFCAKNLLADIDTSQNPALWWVDFSGNQLVDVDISYNINVTNFRINNNPNLQSVDIRNANNLNLNFTAVDNPNLSCVLVDDINYVPSHWDVDPHASFGENAEECLSLMAYTFVQDPIFEQTLIDLGYDTHIDGKVLTSNINTIQELDVNGKGITDLGGIKGFAALRILKCESNNLYTLNTYHNTLLKEIECSHNNIYGFNTLNNLHLEKLIAEGNNMSSIDFRNNPVLSTVNLNNSNISVIDLSYNPELETLHAQNTNLSHLDLRNGNNSGLVNLNIQQNPSLSCIFVDDPNNIPSSWLKDDSATYVETWEECNALGTIENVKVSFKIYPNPTNEYLNIQSDGSILINNIKVYNTSGQLLIQRKATEKLDVSELPTGLYFIRLETDNGALTKRFVKN